jgi:hypothetical protein
MEKSRLFFDGESRVEQGLANVKGLFYGNFTVGPGRRKIYACERIC